MIDQFSDDGTGWARFSNDLAMRYRLARSLTGRKLEVHDPDGEVLQCLHDGSFMTAKRAVFLLLNPSDATAFKPDPTVTECRKRAVQLGADVLEVVNLFAFRSPYPAELKKRAHGQRGDDHENNHAIMEACTGAFRVIAAWGNDGALGNRALRVLELLKHERIDLYHLGFTQHDYPKHPLARGKHRIPADLQPQLWRAAMENSNG